jgi:hypothetical protein
MRRSAPFWGLGAVVALGAALMLLTTFASAASSGGAAHVRWDIISIPGGTPGPGAQVNPGGHASATAPNGGDTITLTGSGTFVAPASGGGSGAATGGGTWSASGGGSGTYTVTGLVSWESAGAQANIGLIDNIDEGTATNGTAVLTIDFSDGSSGVLTVGCHGPGAPPGIFEGIATTKSYKTYYTVPAPVAGVDAGRTIFHVR